jgi:hypothetical protein
MVNDVSPVTAPAGIVSDVPSEPVTWPPPVPTLCAFYCCVSLVNRTSRLHEQS